MKRYAVTSYGLWRKREDLRTLLDARSVSLALPTRNKSAECFIGWGRKPSGQRALTLASSTGTPLLLLEDGFLRSYLPGNDEPSASFVLDALGMYYDASAPSTLETLIADGVDDQSLLSRSHAAIKEIRCRRLSKYNNSPQITASALGLPRHGRYVLLLDQVDGDASIIGSGAKADSFLKMLKHARDAFPNHAIMIRGHPAAGTVGKLEEFSRRTGIGTVLTKRANLWPIIEDAVHVYTVSSHGGFEALMCGKPVTCFGSPYYAGWGLTQNEQSLPRRNLSRTVEAVFAAAYLIYSRYLDVHERYPSTLENTIDALTVVRDGREKNRSRVITVGFSLWRRNATRPFLISTGGRPRNARTYDAALRMCSDGKPSDVVLWGGDTQAITVPPWVRIVRMEDGFVRSVGLGAALRFPNSLVRDTASHLYLDARGIGTIEMLLKQSPPTIELVERAARLRKMIVESRVTKYGAEASGKLREPIVPEWTMGRLKIFVPGQVEDDASIRYGTTDITTNSALLAAVRALYPDALIAYRDHPDVIAGLRKGRAERSCVDVDVAGIDVNVLFDWCDRVETMTSLTGFEILLRGKPVGVHGWPFYAGWGLTDDRCGRKARGAVSLDMLAAAALILYPDYVHPSSGLPCSPERIVRWLGEPRAPRQFDRLLYGPAGMAIGRLKHFAGTLKSLRVFKSE